MLNWRCSRETIFRTNLAASMCQRNVLWLWMWWSKMCGARGRVWLKLLYITNGREGMPIHASAQSPPPPRTHASIIHNLQTAVVSMLTLNNSCIKSFPFIWPLVSVFFESKRILFGFLKKKEEKKKRCERNASTQFNIFWTLWNVALHV